MLLSYYPVCRQWAGVGFHVYFSLKNTPKPRCGWEWNTQLFAFSRCKRTTSSVASFACAMQRDCALLPQISFCWHLVEEFLIVFKNSRNFYEVFKVKFILWLYFKNLCSLLTWHFLENQGSRISRKFTAQQPSTADVNTESKKNSVANRLLSLVQWVGNVVLGPHYNEGACNLPELTACIFHLTEP